MCLGWMEVGGDLHWSFLELKEFVAEGRDCQNLGNSIYTGGHYWLRNMMIFNGKQQHFHHFVYYTAKIVNHRTNFEEEGEAQFREK